MALKISELAEKCEVNTVSKINEVEQKIDDLLRIKRLLYDLKEKCLVEKDLYECPIIETLMPNNS